MYSNKQG